MKLLKRGFNLLCRIKRKYFKPRVMRRLEIEGTVEPRKRIRQPEAGSEQLIVWRLAAGDELAETKKRLKALLEEKYGDLIRNRSILIKYNLNTANPYPASVCPHMLRAAAEIFHELGAREIKAGDCCTIRLLPTRNQVKKAGLAEALAGLAEVVCFDDGPWVRVPIAGRYLTAVTVPKLVFEADTIIALANLKTHIQAVYTGAIKLAVGFMHPLERIPLHRDHLQEKVAEINLALQADLYLVDARTALITGGPDHGRLAEGKTVLVGENPLAVDIEAYRLLYRLKEENGFLQGFLEDPFSLAQLRHAAEMGVGGSPWAGYRTEDLN